MAVEYWIQLENRPWDLSPHNLDRMTGQNMQAVTGKPPVQVTLASENPSIPPRMVTMFNPLRDAAGNVTDALILRRYHPPVRPDGSDAWTIPMDRKINPWDVNEHNPGESGTMGTIPGPVIECQVGDTVLVHFRNADARVGKDALTRTHSLHPHGFVFRTTSDGAYPLTPPDQTQPVGGEAAAWASVGVNGAFKQGDRIPPGGTFTYTWETLGWPSTAGVWLYHDHSVCDMENIELGAIGIIVIHNNAGDLANEVDIRLRPDDPVDPSDAHTFHLHGHRWILPGPDGNDPIAIQGSPQNHPVSQFEDVRMFGPANSFVFTINGQSGSFMRAGGRAPDASLGEWHMHCHVLNHMMTGMMGSLLIIRGGELAFGLPSGVPCPPDTGGTAGTTTVHLTTGAQFSPRSIMINAGDTVTWVWDDGTDHSVTSDTGIWDSGVKNGGPPFPQFSRTFPAPGTFPYRCVIHGESGGLGMSGTVTVM